MSFRSYTPAASSRLATQPAAGSRPTDRTSSVAANRQYLSGQRPSVLSTNYASSSGQYAPALHSSALPRPAGGGLRADHIRGREGTSFGSSLPPTSYASNGYSSTSYYNTVSSHTGHAPHTTTSRDILSDYTCSGNSNLVGSHHTTPRDASLYGGRFGNGRDDPTAMLAAGRGAAACPLAAPLPKPPSSTRAPAPSTSSRRFDDMYHTSSTTYGSRSPAMGSPTTTATEPTSPASAPSTARLVEPMGLANMGNTCYINAALQCLLAVPGLVDGARREGRSVREAKLAKDLIDLADTTATKSRNERSVIASSIKKQATERNSEFYGTRQNDSHEFVRLVLLMLHEQLNRVRGKVPYQELKDIPNERQSDAAARWWAYHRERDDSIVYDVLGGQTKSVIVCDTCGYESLSFDPTLELMLDLPPTEENLSVGLLLAGFTRAIRLTNLDRFHCPRCKTARDARRQVTIQRLPRVLTLAMGRFDRRGRKNGARVAVSEELVIDGDMFSGEGGGPHKYTLCGVVIHSGGADYGHYYAYVRVGRQWYRCDDSIVREVGASQVLLDATSAYILFYEQQGRR